MDLDKFSSMKRKQIGNLILKILRNETYNSCRRVSLVAKMAKAKDVKHLKGSKRSVNPSSRSTARLLWMAYDQNRTPNLLARAC